MNRQLVTSGSQFEPKIGFSRAVRVGQVIAVSGTAPIAPDGGAACPGDLGGRSKNQSHAYGHYEMGRSRLCSRRVFPRNPSSIYVPRG